MVRGFTSQTGSFDFYIGNLPSQTIHKYRLNRDWSQPPCSGDPRDPYCNREWSVGSEALLNFQISPQARVVTEVYGQPVETYIADAFANLVKFYYVQPVGWKKYYEIKMIDLLNPTSPNYRRFYDNGRFTPKKVPSLLGETLAFPLISYPDPTITAHDVVNSGPKQNQFLDTIQSSALQKINIGMVDATNFLSALHIIDASKLSSIVLLVEFTDGSRIKVVLDKDQPDGFRIDESSARDSHGNSIPVRRSQLDDRLTDFNFQGPGNSEDASKMWNRLDWLGIGMGNTNPGSLRYSCGPNRNGSHGVTCNIH